MIFAKKALGYALLGFGASLFGCSVYHGLNVAEEMAEEED